MSIGGLGGTAGLGGRGLTTPDEAPDDEGGEL